MDRELSSAMRIVDANANRAAEGLRSIEDYARLVAEDNVAAAWVKQLRHQLADALQWLDRNDRLRTRSTATDAGTGNAALQELSRGDLAAIIPAAAERTTQALRCLEEYAKLLSTDASDAFKQLRYEAYDKLAQAELRLRRPRFPQHAHLYLLIDCAKPLEAFVQYLRELSSAGVDLFQLRDKQADGGRLMSYGRAAVATLAETESRLILNDRVDVALSCGAAGVHLGQDDMSLSDARRLANNNFWIGVSTHDIEQAKRAEQGGADYVGCGPTFTSRTKGFEQFAGPEFLNQAAETLSVPAFAIGGIGEDNLTQVLDAGFTRIAVSSAIHQAADPVALATQLARRLKAAATSQSAP